MPAATEHDQSALWDEIEANYWRSVEARRAREDLQEAETYRARLLPVRAELEDLYFERKRLEEHLASLTSSFLENEAVLANIEGEQEARKNQIAKSRAHDDEEKRAWFRSYREGGGDYVVEGSAPEDAAAIDEAGGVEVEVAVDHANGRSPICCLEGACTSEPEHARDDRIAHPTNGDVTQEDSGLDDVEVPAPRWSRTRETSEKLERPAQQNRAGRPPGETTGVQLQDESGRVLEELRRVDYDSRRIDTILAFPVKQPVRLRSSRPVNLGSIYESLDGRFEKLVACYIQATGDVQAEPCQACLGSLGVFAECVVLDSSTFPRCGNCEWARQACRTTPSKPSVEQAATSQHQEGQPSAGQPSAGADPGAAAAASGEGRNDGYGDSDDAYMFADEPPSRPRLGSTKSDVGVETAQSPMGDNNGDGASPPARTRRQSSRSQTPKTGALFDPDKEATLNDINRETLELRDDGMVFTDPPCMRGVPLVKITPDHAYWEPEWKSLEDVIQSTLSKHMERNRHTLGVPATTTTERTNRWHTNQQINRGKTVLKFLRNGEFHPYQLVGKQWITSSVATYDALFRLATTLHDLSKFKLDVRPSEWLRQRLHEIHVEQGDKFDLAKTIRGLYRDEKLAYLRKKHGIGTIGRPWGFKVKADGVPPTKGENARKRKKPHPTPSDLPLEEGSEIMDGQPEFSSPTRSPRRNESPAPAGRPMRRDAHAPGSSQQPAPSSQQPAPSSQPPRSSQKRESHSSSRQTPRKDTQPTRSSQRKTRHSSAEAVSAQQTIKAEADKPSIPSRNLPKKQKLDHQGRAGGQPAEDLEHSGYTSTDSFSGDRVVKLDWRVYQIKTARQTTNPTVTQYWHWVDRAEDGTDCKMFEHQVLKDVAPGNVSWGVYKDPYDFHLRLSEMVEIAYSPDSQKIIVTTRPVTDVAHRGDILAHFKRERTKRRFLSFLKKKGVRLVRTTKQHVEVVWHGLQSEVLPGHDSD